MLIDDYYLWWKTIDQQQDVEIISCRMLNPKTKWSEIQPPWSGSLCWQKHELCYVHYHYHSVTVTVAPLDTFKTCIRSYIYHNQQQKKMISPIKKSLKRWHKEMINSMAANSLQKRLKMVQHALGILK